MATGICDDVLQRARLLVHVARETCANSETGGRTCFVFPCVVVYPQALVGTDSVAQARNFNEAFGGGRHLDGFIISKCDTVGDMVGTLVSLVHATNVPVLFVGIGQHYTDLRNFSVRWAVDKLLSPNTA